MDDRFNILSQSLFQKSLDNSSIEEILSFTKEYPYFAPAQFLLLKRLDPTSEEYKNQYQKALLLHPDPLSFGQLINPQTENNDLLADQSEMTPVSSKEVRIEDKAPATAIPAVSGLEPATAEPEIDTVALESPKEKASGTEAQASAGTEAGVSNTEIKKIEKINEIPPKSPVSELTFEPFHTVDYFASQGIKFSQEEAPKDQLGKQLKSFTEWLKTMKRLPATDLNKSVDVVAEKKVEHLAEDSVQNSEVLTEAMAEVWQHQGNPQKAIEIYNKLSLLNPSKRAYFASKIDSLKKSF